MKLPKRIKPLKKSNTRVLYLCDGMIPECKKSGCYKKGGPCKHTSNINHAVNFENKGHQTFMERCTTSNT